MYLGKKVTHAVVTVAVYFNNAERQATISRPWTGRRGFGRGGTTMVGYFRLWGERADVPLPIGEGVFGVLTMASGTRLGDEDFNIIVSLTTSSSGTRRVVPTFRATSRYRRAQVQVKCALEPAVHLLRDRVIGER